MHGLAVIDADSRALLKTPFCYHVMAAETILKLQPHTQFLYFRLTYPKVSFLSLIC